MARDTGLFELDCYDAIRTRGTVNSDRLLQSVFHNVPHELRSRVSSGLKTMHSNSACPLLQVQHEDSNICADVQHVISRTRNVEIRRIITVLKENLTVQK